ncbi:hypothetical protein SAMN04488239_10147 [Ruegeria marina]|uniref:Uncharacterized protein n=1 Tax=Ruegeria marina TaxID=639004 RepID=A0A1G6I7L0_9RHOB|nr:hypothetical protein SAMN04488239_10147 [Ruegeria marina]
MLALPSLAWSQQSDTQTNIDDVQAEVTEAFEVIGAYSAGQREKALDAVETTLARIDQQIDDLERRVRDQWADMSEATRERTTASLSALRERRNRLSQAFGALSQGTGSAWDDLMMGVRNGWTDLETAWDETAAALDSDPNTGE